jgi:hypothetical protein
MHWPFWKLNRFVELVAYRLLLRDLLANILNAFLEFPISMYSYTRSP